MKFTRSKPTNAKKLLSEDAASTLLSETITSIINWDKQSSQVRQHFYDLVRGDAFLALKYKSENKLFRYLCELSSHHRSTLYDYKNAALMEVELELEHGKLSVSALLELKSKTTPETRKEIWPLVEQICHFDEKNPTPTRAIIAKAKNHHWETSPEGKAKLEAYMNDLGDDVQDDSNIKTPVEQYDKNRQMTAERALSHIKAFNTNQIEILSKSLFPKTKLDKTIYRILHESSDKELGIFKQKFREFFEASDENDFTDEEVTKFNAEYHAFCVSSDE